MPHFASRLLLPFFFLVVSSVSASEPDACISGDVVIGCLHEEDLDTIASYKGDAEAAKKALVLGITSGQCATFQNGEPVYVVDRAIFSERRKVRRPGALPSYWMPAKWTKDSKDCHAAAAAVMDAAPEARSPAIKPGVMRAPSTPNVESKPEQPKCVVKPVMTDDDIAACRKAH